MLLIVVILLFAGAIVLSVVTMYNNLVSLRENVKNGWFQIDVQLKRRHDLIPNLVNTAKGYMAHEKETLENVIKARQQAVDASNVKDKQAAENFLSSTLRSLFAVSENYPNLKADRQMMQLHEELVSTENKISFARQYYNDEVLRLNTKIKSFPTNVIANQFKFEPAEFFEVEDKAEKKAPEVKF